MSIHCLICGHQANWLPDDNGKVRECEEEDNTWTIMKLYHDHLIHKPKKRMIEHWWVHTLCLKRFIEEKIEDDSRLKFEPKWCK